MTLDQTLGGCGGFTDAVNASSCESDPVNGATGNFTKQVRDLSLGGIGIPFALTRSYNSLDTSTGPFGPGWTHSYNASLSIAANGDVTYRAGSGQRVLFTKQPDGSFVGASGARATLTSVSGNYELVRYDQTHLSFDGSGRMTSMTDRNGKGLSLSYDGGRLATITDSAGRVVNLSYNPTTGLLTGVALPDGRNVGYAYTNGRLTSVVDARGNTVTYTYETHGFLASEADQSNHTVFRNTYGNDGRVTQQLDALDNRTTFSWDASTQTSTVTDARNNVWKDTYANNMLVKRVDPLANTTIYAYDSDFNLTSVTDPRGKSTAMTYDGRGNLLTRTAPAPLSYQEVSTYNSRNDLVTVRDGRGNTTGFGYDANGNLTSITEPGSVVTELGRDPGGTGLLASVTDPRGKTTTFANDSAGNLTSVTTPLGFTTTLGYDASGRMTSSVEPRGNVLGADPEDYRTTYAYDNADQLTRVTNPLGHAWSYAYDPVGNRTAVTDPRTHVTGYAYDAASRLSSVTAPGGAATTYAYDGVGNITGRTDPNNHATAYSYDAANELSSLVTAAGQKWTYAYDAAGNLTSVVDANGNASGAPPGSGTTGYGYDAIDRLVSIDYSDSTPDVSYGYDANGDRTSMSDGAGTQTSTYDALDQLTRVGRGSDSFAYEYDVAGDLLQETYPGGRVIAYTYDEDGRLATTSSNTLSTGYTYDPAGNLTRTELPSSNGYVESRAHDRAGRLTSVQNAKGGSTLSSFAYSYDAAGNPTQVTTVDGVVSYGYDARDLLTSACYQASCSGGSDPFIDYAYDPVGNRTSETRPQGTTSYTYNAADELTSSDGPGGTTSYAYDHNGNQTAAGNRTFSYDLANRIVSTASGGTTITYGHGGDGNRLQASGGGSTTNYLWDVSGSLPQIALERDGGSPLRSYLYGNDLVSIDEAGQAHYFQRDGLGSIANLTSATGDTEWSYTYEPFGAPRTTTQNDPQAPENVVRFASELYDTTTGLYNLRARQYEPTTGRFLAMDAVPEPATKPHLSSYTYADNRPSVLVDPSGLGAVWNHSGEGCMGFLGILRCGARWGTEGAGLPDYIRGLRHDPAKIVIGTAMDIGGVAIIYGGFRLTRKCMRESVQFHKPDCFMGGGLLGVTGVGMIASGTATIREAEEGKHR